jgi:hypothetical protein
MNSMARDLRRYVGTVVKQTAIKAPAVRRLVQSVAKLWSQSKFRELYSQDAPSPATEFNIVRNAWSSAIPGFEAGGSPLFDDLRSKWMEAQLGSSQNKRVLDLGALEGEHARMIKRAGANVVMRIVPLDHPDGPAFCSLPSGK